MPTGSHSGGWVCGMRSHLESARLSSIFKHSKLIGSGRNTMMMMATSATTVMTSINEKTITHTRYADRARSAPSNITQTAAKATRILCEGGVTHRLQRLQRAANSISVTAASIAFGKRKRALLCTKGLSLVVSSLKRAGSNTFSKLRRKQWSDLRQSSVRPVAQARSCFSAAGASSVSALSF